jgi:hypothetical protein
MAACSKRMAPKRALSLARIAVFMSSDIFAFNDKGKITD